MSAPTAASPPLPLRHCYWVVPGLLLAGEHPNGPNRDKTKDRLKKLLAAGIECFVDLTKPTELQRYDTHLPFYVEYTRKAVKDHGLPGSREQMVEILEHVANAMRAGRPVYVHCRAGIGRTGTVIGCLLVEHGLSGDGALDELNRLWQQSKRSKNWAYIPETDAQSSYVREWKPGLKSGAFELNSLAAAVSAVGPMSAAGTLSARRRASDVAESSAEQWAPEAGKPSARGQPPVAGNSPAGRRSSTESAAAPQGRATSGTGAGRRGPLTAGDARSRAVGQATGAGQARAAMKNLTAGKGRNGSKTPAANYVSGGGLAASAAQARAAAQSEDVPPSARTEPAGGGPTRSEPSIITGTSRTEPSFLDELASAHVASHAAGEPEQDEPWLAKLKAVVGGRNGSAPQAASGNEARAGSMLSGPVIAPEGAAGVDAPGGAFAGTGASVGARAGKEPASARGAGAVSRIAVDAAARPAGAASAAGTTSLPAADAAARPVGAGSAGAPSGTAADAARLASSASEVAASGAAADAAALLAGAASAGVASGAAAGAASGSVGDAAGRTVSPAAESGAAAVGAPGRPASAGDTYEDWAAAGAQHTSDGRAGSRAHAQPPASTPEREDPAPAEPVVGSDPLYDPATLAVARQLRERFVGTLFGLAVGDAVAAATQFRRAGSFSPVGDMLGGGPFDLPRGAWSDDTAMALCLAESLLECDGFDARDQVHRYTRWQQEGYLSATGQCVGITANTARSLAIAQWRRVVFPGSHDPEQLDPEPLSRVASVALFSFASLETTLQQAADSSRTTCQAPAVLDACRRLARALHAALAGQPKEQILAEAGPIPESPPHANSTAATALDAAFWAFSSTRNFRDAVLRAANVGGNSDVVAAVCGQLAGAHYGMSAIPQPWRNGLIEKDLIEGFADRLLAHGLISLSV